jgi:type IV pilus assembly protein PilN
MIRINLLPTRKRKAIVLPPSLIYGAIGGVVVIILLVGYTLYLNSKISSLNQQLIAKQQRLNQMKTKLREVENYERDNAEFRRKAQIIEKLKSNQAVPLRLLDEVSEMLPKGVWLTSLQDKGGSVSIEGYAFSNSDLVTYVQNLKGSKYFEDVELIESRQTEIEKFSVYKFKLTFRIKV